MNWRLAEKAGLHFCLLKPRSLFAFQSPPEYAHSHSRAEWFFFFFNNHLTLNLGHFFLCSSLNLHLHNDRPHSVIAVFCNCSSSKLADEWRDPVVHQNGAE